MQAETLAGYNLLECLHRTAYSQVYRARKSDVPLSVILKVLDKSTANIDYLNQLRNEYEILSNLSPHEGIPETTELINNEDYLILVLSDFEGLSLDKLQKQDTIKLTPEHVVNILCQCVATLDVLHQQHLIHKDIKPGNILWNSHTNKIQLIDFGLSAAFNQKLDQFYQPTSLEGSICYMPPEQTGRVNRQVDYRSDYYALGVTAYQLTTRLLPFETGVDIDELLYSLLATEATPPILINTTIPPALSAIIMRLIAKDAEDRYQTASGLIFDLSKCLDNDELALGINDIPKHFSLPQKVYGREKELGILELSLKNSAAGGSESVFVSGYSGVGKTALIHELYRSVLKEKGTLIEGKFDQLQRNRPLFAFTLAFDDFFSSILTKPPFVIESWQQQLTDKLDDNLGIVTALIPSLEHLVGKQSEPLFFGGEEGVNRLVFSFQTLVKLIATPQHPLVIFIDDLQWVDHASLILIEQLIKDQSSHYILMLGAYRENEVKQGHILFDFMSKLQAENVTYEHLQLDNLDSSAITQIIEDGFQKRINSPEILVSHLYKKTAGNPFFTIQFILMLIDKNLIQMSTDNHWVYNQDEIASLTVADNVVELMIEKIQTYSSNSVTLLSSAAAIGHEFDLKTLGVITEKTENQIKEGILPLLQSGILIGSELSYYFAHDGIQRAAYQITNEQNRIALHKKIGSLLLLSYKDDKSALKNNVFDICFHLNQSKHLISLDQDLDNLISLNLMATTNAKQSAAYQAAFDYISIAVKIIEDNNVSLKHTTTFSVFREAAECSYLCGLDEEAKQYITKAHLIAETNYEKCLLINLQIIQLVSMGDYVQSMKLGFEGLALYNIKLPCVNDSASINAYYDKQQRLFFDSWLNKGKVISDLYNLPLSNDNEIGLVMEMFGSLYASALMSYPDYLKIITIEMLSGAIKYGNTPTSPIGYAWHGSTIAATSDDYKDAYAFGQLAIRLNEEKVKNPAISCKIYNMVGNFIAFFNDPLRETNTLLRKAYELGLSSGDKLYGGYSIINELRNTLSTGLPLPQWLNFDSDVKCKLEKLDAQVMVEVRESFRAYAIQMAGQSLSALSMDNNQFCEHDYRKKYAEVPLFCALLDGWKIQSSYLLGDFKQALTLSCFDNTPIDGFLLGVEFRFFAGLTLAHFLSCDTELNPEQTSRYKLHFDSYLNNIEILSNSCPENFLHLWLMLKGEQARINNNTLLAADYFNRAIQSAKNNEFIHYEALSHELSGALFLKIGIKETGSAHIAQAYDLFERWGAEEKLKQLEQSFPDISFFRQPNGTHAESVSGFVGKQEITHRIDLKGIVDASLALSSEMNLSVLINQLMRVALESSGAQKGVLLQCLQSEWKVVAERSAIGHSEVVLTLSEAEEKLPLSIIHYVMRTGKSVLLGDASTHDLFTDDRYISRHSIKSVNCLPLVHNGKTGAILYLENNLGKNTFTREKNQSLELLSAQMAAAIENAANYQYLYDSKQQYKVLLKSLPIGVMVHDAETRISYANPEAHRMFQTGLNDISGLVVTDIEGQIYNEEGKVLEISAHPVNKVLLSGKAIHNIIYGYKRPKENSPRWYMASAFPQHKQKKIENIVACYIDMTDRRENEAKIQHLAYYDTLTDLPNRTYLENTLERLIAKTLDTHQYSAIVLLDMDNFKVINDSLGHWIGDKMLQEVANRMRIHINQDSSISQESTISQECTIARLGGDEFVIAISSLCSNRENFIHIIETITSQVQGIFSEPFVIEGHQLNSTVSIGIAISPDDGKNADELLRHADTALYKAKKEGRNAVCYFHREQENELHRRLKIESELRVAIDSNQLRLLYQPKVDVASGAIVGAEALVRWQHPHKGTISPVEFIPVAEESGLIISLGEWVLKEACHQVKHWKEKPEFKRFQRMSVNVSPFQFNHNNFQTVVESALGESGLNPNFLDLEVTESLLLEHMEETVEKMNYFKAMGISFSIDDFGTGYSSLAYLKRLPVDVLKVDQSFVRDMTTDEGDRAIVKTVLAMASSLHLKTVAEGVETLEHLEILKKLGCLQYQGYLFSKPITAKEFEVLISAEKCATT